jgi:hypothetical protein
MSVVTGFVLVRALAEDILRAGREPGGIAEINRWLEEKGFVAPAEVADKHALSSKHPQFYLYTAGYNHFPEDDFIEFFRSLEW